MSCEYFKVCPLRRLEREGKISLKWSGEFCQTQNSWKKCARYQDEKKGVPHSDNKMPDGTIKKFS